MTTIDQPSDTTSPPGRTAAGHPIKIRLARHPYQPSRHALAWSAILTPGVVIVILWDRVKLLLDPGSIEAPIIAVIAGTAIIAALSIVAVLCLTLLVRWFVLQLRLARTIGMAARITPPTLPDVCAVIDNVRYMLNYYKKVRFYAADNVSEKVKITSLFGRQIILIDGDLLADAQADETGARLRFLVGASLGALKAGHFRFWLVSMILKFFDSLKYAWPLMLPYKRATRYTADQLGLLCAGDLAASLAVMNRMMVGTDLAPNILPASLLRQANAARVARLTRLIQLSFNSPHLIYRYANLIEYAAVTLPLPESIALAEHLDPESRYALRRLLAKSPHRDRGNRLPSLFRSIGVPYTSTGGRRRALAGLWWGLALNLIMAVAFGSSIYTLAPDKPASREPTNSQDVFLEGSCYTRESFDRNLPVETPCAPGSYNLVKRFDGSSDFDDCTFTETDSYTIVSDQRSNNAVLCLRMVR